MIPESDRRNPNLSEADLRASQEAAEHLTKLKAIEGKKAFFLVVDDKPENLEFMRDEYIAVEAARTNTGYAISTHRDGESAIRLYRAFREQEEPEHRNPVVAVLDGQLDGRDRYKSGTEVARQLVEISTANGWNVPYLVGGSSEPAFNKMLEQAFPDHHVSSINSDSQEEFDAIDANLLPPQSSPQK